MHSDKSKIKIKTILQSSFLPLIAFAFSFVNIFAFFVRPTNYCNLAEIISNDVLVAKKEKATGLVEFSLTKLKSDYNFIYGGRYYLDQIYSINKKGKSFVNFENYAIDLNLGNESTQKFEIDYSIGLTDASSFKSLNINLNDGSLFTDGYGIDTKDSHCVISQSLFNEIASSSSEINDKQDIIGKSINYVEASFIVDAVADDTSFVSKALGSSSNRYIALRYGRISNKDVFYTYHLYLNKTRYYDNYSIFRYFFNYLYRRVNDYYFTISVPNNEWICDDIDNFRIVNGTDNIVFGNAWSTIAYIGFALTIGIIAGALACFVFKTFKSGKQSFYILFFTLFAYFVGYFFFGLLFNHLFLTGFHINTFSSFATLFSMMFAVTFMLPIIVFSLFGDRKTYKEMVFKPLVSIVIPVYNGENYLRLSVESALKQTYENIEVIVVDDGSTDGGKAKEIVDGFQDSRLQYYHKENGGVATALNFGIKKASGEYICWLSHDDLLPPEKIMSQILLIESWGSNKKIIPYSDNYIIDENGNKARYLKQRLFKVSEQGAICPSEYFSIKQIIFGSLLVPKEFFNSNEFISELRYSQDTFAFFQILKNGYELRYSRDGYIKYRVHSSQGSFTRSNEAVADVYLMHDYFKEYFIQAKDYKFINACLMYYAKSSAGFKYYQELYNDLISNKKKYDLSKITILESKVVHLFYKLLYKIKRKILGR